MPQIDTRIVGAAGEHYVLCQLLRRGWIATKAPKGVPNMAILVTDGILETTDADGNMFGEDRLFENIAQHQSSSAAEIVAGLFSAARRFAGDQSQRDDNSAVIIKVGAA